MKKLIFYLTTVTSLISIAFFSWYFFIRIERIAYIDAARILREYKGAVDARKELEGKTQQWQANIDTLTADVQKAISEYEASQKKDQAGRNRIREKQNQLTRYQQAIQQNATEEEAKATSQVVEKVNAFLATYGKEHGYKLILIANQVGTIAYAAEGMDITDEVLKILNSEKYNN